MSSLVPITSSNYVINRSNAFVTGGPSPLQCVYKTTSGYKSFGRIDIQSILISITSTISKARMEVGRKV